jgi:phage shock protein PspC (stress-responsive transcriptional regulator)
MTTNDDTPEPGTPGSTAGAGDPAPPVDRNFGAGFFDSIRRTGIARSNDRWIGGVAAGVAERYGLDPLLVRGLLILSVFVVGLGLVLYGVAWLLLPERSDGRIHLQETFRGTFDVAVLGAGLLILFGFISGSGIWPWWGGPAEWVAVMLWIAFWVAVVWLLVKLVRSRRRDGGMPPSSTWTPGPTPGAPGTPPAPGPDAGPAHDFTPAPRAHYVAPPAAPSSGTTDTSWTAETRGGTWASGAGLPGHVTTPVPPRPTALPDPPKPPPPPRRPSPSAGFTTVGVVVGLSLLIGAGLLATDLAVGLAFPVWSLWLALSTFVVGAAIIVSGLRGRRGGWLTFLAILALVATAATWPFADGRGDWRWDEWTVQPDEQVTTLSGTTLSDGTVTPRSIDSAEDGVRVHFGSATVDLTELDLSGTPVGDPVVVPIEMTAGRTVIEIPRDTPVTASVNLNAGTFAWNVDGENLTINGFSGGPATYQTDEVADEGGAVLQLDVDARAGELVIEEH